MYLLDGPSLPNGAGSNVPHLNQLEPRAPHMAETAHASQHKIKPVVP